ncbi:MAG: ribosomal protein S18-alanine N-acetyltransferase [Vagococcus sp.]|uniref:ribosomal protein S18-alanine N-acetyltransferase n=1 Tax=Vagococcus TaxID=2737 RepID=UPI002FCC75AF
MLNESNHITFEVANLTDIYLLQETLKRVYGKSPWSYTIFWSELIRKNTSRYLKVFNNYHYVGFIGIRTDETEAHITNIAVLPSHQNQGFGYLLLKEGESFARAKGCLTISLEVKKSNIVAIELYKKYGYFVTGIKQKYYKENNEDALEMTYVLEG